MIQVYKDKNTVNFLTYCLNNKTEFSSHNSDMAIWVWWWCWTHRKALLTAQHGQILLCVAFPHNCFFFRRGNSRPRVSFSEGRTRSNIFFYSRIALRSYEPMYMYHLHYRIRYFIEYNLFKIIFKILGI